MCKIICEIGKNFVISEQEENIDVLLKRTEDLILKAKECGCNTAKFQVHCVDDEILPDSNLISPHFNQDRYEWIKRNTYSIDFWWQVKEYCREIGIEFLATPMSRGAAILLNEEIGVDRWKIGSADILDFVMLDYIRDTNKPIILSSGMSSFEELKKSYEFLKEKTNDISILHCVSQYPCPIENLNLNTIKFLKREFPKVKIGYSSHYIGIEDALIAINLGAEIIEKHFTLSRSNWGADHKVSILPDEMKELVNRIRNNEKINLVKYHKALGIETKWIQLEEMEFRKVFRKGLYAGCDIKQGDIFEWDMIYAMRPQNGVKPSENYYQFLGNRASRNYKKYEII